MLPARVLTIAGISGPITRTDVVNAIGAFAGFYGSQPAAMTVTPAGLDQMDKFAGGASPSFRDRVLANSRPDSPNPVQFAGLTVTVGPAYTLTD